MLIEEPIFVPFKCTNCTLTKWVEHKKGEKLAIPVCHQCKAKMMRK